jgi:hypothetical protein
MVQRRAWEQAGQEREGRVVVSSEATLQLYFVQNTMKWRRLPLSRAPRRLECAT